jgi:hypothetical protein
MCRVSVRPVHACFVRSYYYYIYRYRKCSSYFILHFSHPAYIIFHTCTSFQFISSHLIFFHLISYLLIYQLTSFFSFHLNIVYFFISPKLVLIYLGSSTRQSPISYYEVYIKYFPLFYIIKFIQHISLYYFVLQNLNKIFPRPILNSKACTQAFSNIILYCNAYTKYIPILF